MAILNKVTNHIVAETLGTQTERLSELCGGADNHVNMWAKYKPIRCNKPVAKTDQDNVNAYYGIKIPETVDGAAYSPTTISKMYNDVMAGKVKWEYLKPRGKAYEEYYRLYDFFHYNHGAVPPVATMGKMEYQTDGSSYTVYFGFKRVLQGNAQYNLALEDLRYAGQAASNTFDEMYVGVCCDDGSGVKAKTIGKYKDVKGVSDELGVGIEVNAGNPGERKVIKGIMFFSTQPLPNAQNLGTLIPVPMAIGEAELYRTPVQVFSVFVVAYTLRGDTNHVYASVRFHNGTSQSQGISNARLYFYDRNGTVMSSSYSIGSDFVLAAGQSKVIDNITVSDGIVTANAVKCQVRWASGSSEQQTVIRDVNPDDPERPHV